MCRLSNCDINIFPIGIQIRIKMKTKFEWKYEITKHCKLKIVHHDKLQKYNINFTKG
jgi:hypothetical protein